MMEEGENYFDLRKLPILIAENIAYHLDGIDLIHLGMTCKYWYEITRNNAVWKVIATKRFGDTATQKAKDLDFKKVYFELSKLKLPVKDFYAIVHLGDRYLLKVDEIDSLCGSVIYLRTVCWLQLNGKFNKVLPGKYRVIWRMKLRNAYINGDEPNIYYKATTQHDFGSQLVYEWNKSVLRDTEKREGTDTWFLHDAGELTVKTLCDVHLEIHGRNDRWCGGFYWDYVELRPVNIKLDQSKYSKVNSKKNHCCLM